MYYDKKEQILKGDRTTCEKTIAILLLDLVHKVMPKITENAQKVYNYKVVGAL